MANRSEYFCRSSFSIWCGFSSNKRSCTQRKRTRTGQSVKAFNPLSERRTNGSLRRCYLELTPLVDFVVMQSFVNNYPIVGFSNRAGGAYANNRPSYPDS